MIANGLKAGLELMQKGIEILLLNLDEAETGDRWMNTRELGEYSGYSPKTITRLIREMEAAGTGGVCRDGRKVRVSRTAFKAFMENRK